MHAPVGFEPTFSSAKYPHSSPPTKMYPGERSKRPLVLENEELRLFTTWNFKNLLCFRMTKASERRKQKPLRSSELGRGSKRRTFEMGSAHFTSTRKCACINLDPTQWVERDQRVLDECEIASHRSFSFLRARLPCAKGRVYDLRSWRRQGENATLQILYLN